MTKSCDEIVRRNRATKSSLPQATPSGRDVGVNKIRTRWPLHARRHSPWGTLRHKWPVALWRGHEKPAAAWARGTHIPTKATNVYLWGEGHLPTMSANANMSFEPKGPTQSSKPIFNFWRGTLKEIHHPLFEPEKWWTKCPNCSTQF